MANRRLLQQVWLMGGCAFLYSSSAGQDHNHSLGVLLVLAYTVGPEVCLCHLDPWTQAGRTRDGCAGCCTAVFILLSSIAPSSNSHRDSMLMGILPKSIHQLTGRLMRAMVRTWLDTMHGTWASLLAQVMQSVRKPQATWHCWRRKHRQGPSGKSTA